MQVRLDPEDVEAIAARVVELLPAQRPALSPWLDAKSAAEYAGCTVNALHKATAARELRFAQNERGGKCWFRPEWIDEWRGH